MTNDFQQWQAAGTVLAGQHSTQKWSIADWLVAGDTAWGGDAYDTATRLFPDLSRKYLTQIAYVARNVTSTVRQDRLSFTHHELVAGLEPAEQERLLTEAVENKWTCGQLRQHLEVDRIQDCSLAVSADLFKQLNEFAQLVNISAAALLTTAVKQFLQSPPEELKAQYKAGVLAQRERYQQQQAERAVRDAEWSAQQVEQKRVADERALFIHDSSIAVMNLGGEQRMTAVQADALKTLREMINRGGLPLAELQGQLDKLIALCKPPAPAPDTEEALVAAD